jgi:hypothetical protein
MQQQARIGRRWARTAQTSDYTGYAQRSLEDRRMKGLGPPYYKSDDGAIFYDLDEVDAWIAAGRRMSTWDDPEPVNTDKPALVNTEALVNTGDLAGTATPRARARRNAAAIVATTGQIRRRRSNQTNA